MELSDPLPFHMRMVGEIIKEYGISKDEILALHDVVSGDIGREQSEADDKCFAEVRFPRSSATLIDGVRGLA